MGFVENEYNLLSSKIIDTCIGVHKDPGPGLMEPVYDRYSTAVNRKMITGPRYSGKVLPVHKAHRVPYLKHSEITPGLSSIILLYQSI